MCMSSLNHMFKYVVQYENISDNADTGYCLIKVVVMFLLFNFLSIILEYENNTFTIFTSIQIDSPTCACNSGLK